VKPERNDSALVGLVDTILEKGAVVNADVVVSVAGVPLLGINLRAAIAGMETMLKYGMMKDWDEGLRNRALERKELYKEV